MNKKFWIRIITLFASTVSAADYTIRFGGVGPGADTIDLETPITGFPVVTSKWNQPRDVGTNPHGGG